MNTWSHVLVGAALNRPIKKSQQNKPSRIPPIRTGWFLFGSALPDMMLIFMAFIAIVLDLVQGSYTLSTIFQRSGGGDGPPAAMRSSNIGQLFGDWFFTNPWVKAGHSIFGTPIMLLVYMLLGYWLWKNGRKWGPAIFWLAAGAMIHTAFDIPLHVDDGPLVFWPLNWDYRFISPISYWDHNHYGEQWSWFEWRLDAVLLAWIIGGWAWEKFRPNPTKIVD